MKKLQLNLLILMMKSQGSAQEQRTLKIIQTFSFSVFAGLISFMISGTFLTQGFTWPFYILMALTIALCQYIEQQYIASHIGQQQLSSN